MPSLTVDPYYKYYKYFKYCKCICCGHPLNTINTINTRNVSHHPHTINTINTLNTLNTVNAIAAAGNTNPVQRITLGSKGCYLTLFLNVLIKIWYILITVCSASTKLPYYIVWTSLGHQCMERVMSAWHWLYTARWVVRGVCGHRIPRGVVMGCCCKPIHLLPGLVIPCSHFDRVSTQPR